MPSTNRTIDGVALAPDQGLLWRAIRAEAGSDQLADQVFALCHVHDEDRWVPLDMFETHERDAVRLGSTYTQDR